MKARLLPVIFPIWMALAACGQIAAPVGTDPALLPATTIPNPTKTPPPTSTSTSTPIPTPIGTTEPRIAFIGKDVRGNLGLYIDGFYTGKPEQIVSVTVPLESATHLSMRWSPDGKQLIFENHNAQDQSSFFLFDMTTRQIRELTPVPDGLTVFALNWSADGGSFYFSGSDRSHRVVHYQVALPAAGLSPGVHSSYINNNAHVNSLTDCSGQFPVAVQLLAFAAAGGLGPNGAIYDRICFYPALKLFAGLKYNPDSTEFVLLSEKGLVQQAVVRFPPQFLLNGFIELSLSPDSSRLLVIGEGGSATGQTQFAFPVELTAAPLDISDPAIWKSITPLQVFGWSPDSLHYLIAEADQRLEVMQAFPPEVAYTYTIHSEVTPLFQVSQNASGFDVLWPASP